MSTVIPELNASGVYTLLAPFDTMLVSGLVYTCIATRKLADFTALGLDPKSKYYDPYGIPDARYISDVAAGVCIVSLQSTGGDLVYVPSSYIKSFPKGGGIPYTPLVLGVSLGAIPDTLDLSYLNTQITALISDTIGVVPEIKPVAVGNTAQVDVDVHRSLEASRLVNITNNKTDRAKLIELQTRYNSLQQKYDQLALWVKERYNET